ncbi:GAF domain-containing protein [Chloroflexales bacterium ZM16-3]|nr:GAF domain-containing protein [Chloroflexales bacterium ZM16-3]
MQLPSTNIRRIFSYALVAGLALGLLIVGFVRVADLSVGISFEGAVMMALLIGALIGLCFMLAIKLSLRQAVASLHQYAIDLSETSLPPPVSHLMGDEVIYMRDTLAQAIASVPRSGSYPEIAQRLALASDTSAALAVAASHIADHIQIQGALLLQLDGERDLLYPAATWGQASLPDDVTLDMHKTAIGRALQERRTAFYSGAQVRDLLPLQVGPESMTLFCFPLMVRGQPFGMLCLTSLGADMRLSDDQRAYARSLADMLTLAIQSNMHRALFDRENDRLSAFEQLGTMLDNSERFEVALEQVLRVAARVTDSMHGTLLLLEPDESRVRYRITLKEGDVLPLSVTAGAILKHGLAGWALRERHADIIDDTERDTRWLPVPGLGEMRSVLVVPLLYGERALGVLTLADPIPRHYSLRSLALASALAAYAVNILARMQYHAMVESGSVAMARRLFEGWISTGDLGRLLADGAAIERALASQTRFAVVVFVGLSGLDRLGESLSADQVLSQVITPYLDELSAIIYDHHGYVEHYDDGNFMAVFGFPSIYGDSRMVAIKAALEIQTVARRLRGRWRSQIGCDLMMSAGLAPGNLTSGLVGTDRHQSYMLIGDAIREARRLQQLARADEVLVSDTLVDSLGSESIFQFESLAPFHLGSGDGMRTVYRLAAGRA